MIIIVEINSWRGFIIERPSCEVIKAIAQKYIEGVISIEDVLKGKSTFVYRVKSLGGVYYIRILPQEESFGGEVLAHNKLRELDVRGPKVLHFEEKNNETGLSVMIVEEIEGMSIEDSGPGIDYKEVMYEAGKQLAKLHSIPVDGFGWIDRNEVNRLKGEKESFQEYFTEFMEADLESLDSYDFSENEKKHIREFMKQAGIRLDVESASLVHGDFDISHIFHADGKFTGIIDFGEIRGNNSLYDLATFIAFYQARRLYSHLINGYSNVRRLTKDDLFDVELMALAIIVRFLGKKVNTKGKNHWYKLAKKQLNNMI